MSVQLAARGPQDIFLTGNPTTTFFKAVFRQYVDFEIITEDQTKNNRQKFDILFENQKRIFQVLIPNKFEYLSNIYISFKSKHQLNAYEQFEYARLKIGGQTIVDLPFEFIYIYDQLNMTDEHISKFYNNHNINDTSTSYKIKTENTQNQTVHKAEFIYYVMLPFFTKRYQTVLPLYLITNHIVEIEFKTKNNHKEIYDFKLFTDYIHIDSQYIYGNEHSLLIEQFQRNVFDFNNIFSSSSNTINTTIDLLFNHPIKELIWVFDKNNDKVGNYASHQIFEQLSIKLEGSSIFTREQIYYSLIQHIQHHTRCPHNIFSFSFSLFPTGYQPSGTINASKIRDFQLDFENINKKEHQPISSLTELQSGTNYILDILSKQSNIVDRSFLISIETLIHFINEKVLSDIPSAINEESTFSSNIDEKIFKIYNDIQNTDLVNFVNSKIIPFYDYLNPISDIPKSLLPYNHILYPNNTYPSKYNITNINISNNSISNFDNYIINSFYSTFINTNVMELGYHALNTNDHSDPLNPPTLPYYSTLPYDLYFDFINYFGIANDYEYFYKDSIYTDGIIISNTMNIKNNVQIRLFKYKKAKKLTTFKNYDSTKVDGYNYIKTTFDNPNDATSLPACGLRTNTNSQYSDLPSGYAESNIQLLPLYNYYKAIAYTPLTFYSTINNQYNLYPINNGMYILPVVQSLSNYIGFTIFSETNNYYPNINDFVQGSSISPDYHTTPNNRILKNINLQVGSDTNKYNFDGYYYRESDPRVNYGPHLKLNSIFYIHDLYDKFAQFMIKLFDRNTMTYKDSLVDIDINKINIKLDLQQSESPVHISCSLENLKTELERQYVSDTFLPDPLPWIINNNYNADSIVEFMTLVIKFHLATNIIFRRFPIGADFTQQFMDYSNIDDSTFINVQHVFNNFQARNSQNPDISKNPSSDNYSIEEQPMVVKYIYDAIFSTINKKQDDPLFGDNDLYTIVYNKINIILDDSNKPIITGGANYPLYRIQHNTLYELSYDNSCFIENIHIYEPPNDTNDTGNNNSNGTAYQPPEPNYAEYFGYGASLNYIYNSTNEFKIYTIIRKLDVDTFVKLSNIRIFDNFYYDLPINSSFKIQNGKINNDENTHTQPMNIKPRMMLLPIETMTSDHSICPKSNIFKSSPITKILFDYLTNTQVPSSYQDFSYNNHSLNHPIFDHLIRYAFNVYWEQALLKLNLKLFDSGIIEDKELDLDSNFIKNTIQSLKVYAVNYNFLDFENGRAGLKFRS